MCGSLLTGGTAIYLPSAVRILLHPPSLAAVF